MIATLRGTVHKMDIGEVIVDVQGVGYKVTVPVDVWDGLQEAEQTMLWVSTYVREDRFDLYGFRDRAGRTMFEEFIKLSGIGPKMGLELCAVPRSMLLQAVHLNDDKLLSNVKGVGKKTAEKLLVELRSLVEKMPDLLGAPSEGQAHRSEFDRDAIETLAALGYDMPTITRTLKDLPPDLKTTEERVAAALRSL
jgi:Holliday junction DNA helicase RuvA